MTNQFPHIKNSPIHRRRSLTARAARTDLRYKSIATSSSDKVKVTNFNKKDSIIFKDKYGVRLKLSDNNILNFSSQSTADTNYIYAYKDTIPVGKLMLNTYAKKTYDIVLVSVNGAKVPNANEIKEYLDKVYHVANVEFNVLTDTLTIRDLENFTHGGSGTFTVYNDSQKKVLEAYDNRIKDKIQYLFFIENVTETEGVGGYNPLGYQCGFIYNGANNRTIAHEIGHGLFSLHHPFADSKQAGKTDNLMDYSFEEELYHYQWDSIQEIQRKWLKWRQDESEGESWFSYPTLVQKFLEEFRYAYVNNTKLNFRFIGEYSSTDLKLLDDKKYSKIGFYVKSANVLVDKDKYSEGKYTSDNFTFFTDDKKTEFEDYIFPEKSKYEQQVKLLIMYILSTKNRIALVQLMSRLPENEFVRFSFEERKQILYILKEGELSETQGIIMRDGNDGERCVINLLKYAPENQKCDLLYFLKNNDDFIPCDYLYNAFCSLIDNVGGDDNNTEFVGIVEQMEKSCDILLYLANIVKNKYESQSRHLTTDQQKYICDYINGESDWGRLLERLDRNNRYIYTYLRDGLVGSSYNYFVKTVYQKTKELSNGNIPLQKRKDYLLYYSNSEGNIPEAEEDIIMDLIETCSNGKSLFDYMSEKELFVPLAKKIDDVGGKDNYTKFKDVCFKIWLKNNPNKTNDSHKNEVLFHRDTQFAFANFITRNIGLAPLGHIEVSVGGQTGDGNFNGSVSGAFGIGWDGLGNVAMYGNFNVCANTQFKNLLRYDAFYNFTNTQDASEKIDKFHNYILGAGVDLSVSLNIDWWAKDMRTLFGVGTTISEGFHDFSFLINSDDAGNVFGYGLGYSKGKGLPIPFSFSRTSDVNFGLIVSQEEFRKLLAIFVGGVDLSKKALEVNWVDVRKKEGKLIFFGHFTDIDIFQDGCCYISKDVIKYY